MKVGIFYPNWPQTLGGGYTFQRDILEALKKFSTASSHEFWIIHPENFTNELLQFTQNSPLKNFPYRKDTSYPYFNFLRHKFSRLGVCSPPPNHFQNAIRESGVDLMWFLVPWHEPVDIPYITVVWDLQHRLQPWFPELSKGTKWHECENIYSKSLPRASFVLTGTKRGAEEIQTFYKVSPENIRILPLPTPSVDAPLPSQPLILPEKYLFYPAQFWPHKNHFNLLKALQILRDEYHENISLVLVGADQGNASYIHDVIKKLKLENAVHLHGFVDRTQLIHTYRNAFALVFPSFFGPDNLPPLEAFATGCPVIASNVPGSEEQLGDAALLFNPKSSKDIAEKILQLLRDSSLRNNLIEKGYSRAKQWTSESYVKEVDAMIRDFESVKQCWK